MTQKIEKTDQLDLFVADIIDIAPKGDLHVTWAFVLEAAGAHRTRLIVRARGGPGYDFHGLPWGLGKPILHAVHFVMQRRQLLGIARRVESWAASKSSASGSRGQAA